MSNCLPCSDPIAPCQGCKKSQECIQTGRSCTQCPRNICIDSSSSSSSSKDSGPSTGTTAGAAVGGVVGVAVLIVLVWWFWWRPKGLEVSRKRYSKHLANRQSKLNMMDPKRKTMDASGDGENVAKRSSVHLKMTGDTTNNRRSQGNFIGQASAAEGVDETVPVSRTSDDDNPFGDQNRSSIGTFNDNASTHTSEFSFRSSHSTNIIPIAYIPPHSSSLSVDDAQRGAYGQHHQPSSSSSPRDRQSVLPPPRSSMNRISIPTSMASRDSLALAGGELIELNPLPPVLIPDQPSIPHGTMSNGAPIRPPRSPGLDLQLPKSSSPLASSPPINSPYDSSTSRPRSGFPFSPSSPTSSTTPSNAQLLPPTSRGMSFLHDHPSRSGSNSAQSNHLSMMSSITSRSGNSTMSYILDPPQIITPVSSGGSGGVKRVEFQQAKAHKLGGGGGGNNNSTSSPTSPLATNDPFSDVNSIDSSSSSKHRRDESRETVTGGGSSSIGEETGSSSRPISSSSRWTTSSLSSEAPSEVQFLQSQTITFTNPNTPSPMNNNTASTLKANDRASSSLSVNDLPTSARSSVRTSYASANENDQDQGQQQRQATWSSTSDSNQGGEGGSQSMSRASSSSHDSLLEGIPFMSPPFDSNSRQLLAGGPSSTSSINLGLPVNVTATQTLESIVSPSPLSNSDTPTAFPPPPARTSTTRSQSLEAEVDEPLPLPFLPFAGQRPTSTSPTKSSGGGGERGSEHFSVRSGFGSGLSQIPFQLGFPSGFGDGEGEEGSERGSVISSRIGGGEGKERWSTAENGEEGLSGVEERTEEGEESIESEGQIKAIAPPIPFVAPPSPSAPPEETVNEENSDEGQDPFGSHAEIDGSDPRASMDTLALSAALSANLEAEN